MTAPATADWEVALVIGAAFPRRQVGEHAYPGRTLGPRGEPGPVLRPPSWPIAEPPGPLIGLGHDATLIGK